MNLPVPPAHSPVGIRLKRYRQWTALLLLLFNTAALAESAVPDLATEAGQRGLLWKIEKPGAAPSYLFGTIHLDDPRVMSLAPPVAKAFGQANSFTMEMLTSAEDLAVMNRKMFFTDGTTLEQVLGKSLYAKTREAIVKRGLTSENLQSTKPWVVIMMLSTPRPKNGMFLDMKLYLDAITAKKPSFGLETMDEQLSAFNDMPLPDQVELLGHTVSMIDQFDTQLEALLQAYLSRDLSRIQAIADSSRPPQGQVFDRFMDRLIHERNHRMHRRMQARLKEGNAFIAVGALHLPGSTGLLALLKAQGYKVIPVW